MVTRSSLVRTYTVSKTHRCAMHYYKESVEWKMQYCDGVIISTCMNRPRYGLKILVDTKSRLQCEDSTCVRVTSPKGPVGMINHVLDSLCRSRGGLLDITFHLFDLALLRFVCMPARASRGPMTSRG